MFARLDLGSANCRGLELLGAVDLRANEFAALLRRIPGLTEDGSGIQFGASYGAMGRTHSVAAWLFHGEGTLGVRLIYAAEDWGRRPREIRPLHFLGRALRPIQNELGWELSCTFVYGMDQWVSRLSLPAEFPDDIGLFTTIDGVVLSRVIDDETKTRVRVTVSMDRSEIEHRISDRTEGKPTGRFAVAAFRNARKLSELIIKPKED